MRWHGREIYIILECPHDDEEDIMSVRSISSTSYDIVGLEEDSIYKYKNEVGYRDDTVPKTVDTRRHCEEE